MSACFDLSGFMGLTNSDVLKYQTYWATFDRIQSYNVAVSTIRASGQGINATYYQYVSYNELGDFKNGQVLHAKRYPSSNWNSVPQN